jgi:hypothetical protein
MSMFDESLERVYLELVTLYVAEKRKQPEGESERAALIWDTIEDLRRVWPQKVDEIEARYRTPAKS